MRFFSAQQLVPHWLQGQAKPASPGSWIYQPGPLSSREPHRDCIRINVAVDWEPENPGPGSLGISNSPGEKSSFPKPGVTSASLPALKASLPLAQVALVLSFHRGRSPLPGDKPTAVG